MTAADRRFLRSGISRTDWFCGERGPVVVSRNSRFARSQTLNRKRLRQPVHVILSARLACGVPG